jgi:hypothetical protein
LSGGSQYYDYDPHDIEDPPDIEYTTFPAGENGLSVAWENAASSASFDSLALPFDTSGNSYNQIHTELMIDAAGQAEAGQTTLYLVQAQVTNKDSGMQVPASELQIQGTALTDMTHDDGSVWSEALVSAPAGVNADVTPRAIAPNTGSDKSLNVLGQECRLTVMANGVPLDPDTAVSNASFCVGQNVVFSVTNLPPGVRATNFEWSFEGTYFNNQSNAVPGVSFPTCSTVPFVDSSLLAQSTATNWWVSGGPNAGTPATYTASVTCALILTNASSGQPCSARGKIYMFRPQATITTKTGTVGVNDTPLGWDVAFGTTNSYATVGIMFSNSISYPSGFGGTTEWTQVITEEHATRQRASDLNYEHWYVTGLDNVYPYQNDPLNNSSSTTDSPGWPLDDGYLELNVLNQAFTMWLLFQPVGGGHWVPLRAVNWNWSASATNQGVNLGWAIEGGTIQNSVNPSDYATEGYPQWTNVILNGQIDWISP